MSGVEHAFGVEYFPGPDDIDQEPPPSMFLPDLGSNMPRWETEQPAAQGQMEAVGYQPFFGNRDVTLYQHQGQEQLSGEGWSRSVVPGGTVNRGMHLPPRRSQYPVFQSPQPSHSSSRQYHDDLLHSSRGLGNDASGTASPGGFAPDSVSSKRPIQRFATGRPRQDQNLRKTANADETLTTTNTMTKMVPTAARTESTRTRTTTAVKQEHPEQDPSRLGDTFARSIGTQLNHTVLLEPLYGDSGTTAMDHPDGTPAVHVPVDAGANKEANANLGTKHVQSLGEPAQENGVAGVVRGDGTIHYYNAAVEVTMDGQTINRKLTNVQPPSSAAAVT